jgi:hypothetical protein
MENLLCVIDYTQVGNFYKWRSELLVPTHKRVSKTLRLLGH